MKTLFILVALCLASCTAWAQQQPVNTRGLSQTDYEALVKAVGLVDKGLADLAIPDFDRLIAANPDNYVVQYERLYALCQMERYADALKDYKKILKHKDATATTYHLVCVALHKENRLKEEHKVLKEGLKRFPDAGMLYCVAGENDLSQNKINEAVANFNTGIERDPIFDKNYAMAGQILCQIDGQKPWGLVYLETAMLLNVDRKHEQHLAMAKMMHDCYMQSVHISADSTYVDLVEKREIITVKKRPDDADALTYADTTLGFPGVFADCAELAAKAMAATDATFTGSIEQLISLRKGILENYYDKGRCIFLDAMYLFPFQKAVIDAGYWEAYNYFLFGYLFPDEYAKWIDDNEGKLNEFVKWYTDGKFVLDGNHTVGMYSIFNGCKIFPLLGSMLIEAQLLGGDPQDAQEIIQYLVDSPKIIDYRALFSEKK